MTTTYTERERMSLSEDRPRVRHIRLPDNPDVAWCGYRKRPDAPRCYWHEIQEADVCVVCLSFPGAREYAMGVAR